MNLMTYQLMIIESVKRTLGGLKRFFPTVILYKLIYLLTHLFFLFS